MTETVEAPPELGLGREQVAAWTQALLALSSLLQQRRMGGMGRLGWSDETHATRLHERARRTAEPAVRAMTEQERALFDRERHAETPSVAVQTRVVDAEAGRISVTVAPVGVDGAWGLAATGVSPDGEVVSEALVRTVDEVTAKRLADDLLRGEPQTVERLHGFTELAAQRAAAAVDEVGETEAQRLERTASTVRRVWPADLADRVIEPSAAGRAAGEVWNRAFGALAWRLHQLEERGYEMAEVLARLDVGLLSRPETRNPAAFAEYFVEGLMGELGVFNLGDSVERDGGAAGRATAPSAAVSATSTDGPDQAEVQAARAAAGRAGPPPRATRTDRVQMAALVRDHLPRAAADKVVGGEGWRGLATLLARCKAEGLPVGELLEALPAGRIVKAHAPAKYTAMLVKTKAALHRRDSSAQDGARSDGPAGVPEAAPDPGRKPDEQQMASGAQGAPHPLEWTEDLDPASAVDRVGLHAAVGLGSPAEDARLEERLRGGEEPSPAAAAAEASAEGRAAGHDRDAARKRATPDDPTTETREDRDGQDGAGVDAHLAAGERARAAELAGQGAAAAADGTGHAAAAARAEVTFTPPGPVDVVPQARPARRSARPGPRLSPSPSPRHAAPDRGRSR